MEQRSGRGKGGEERRRAGRRLGPICGPEVLLLGLLLSLVAGGLFAAGRRDSDVNSVLSVRELARKFGGPLQPERLAQRGGGRSLETVSGAAQERRPKSAASGQQARRPVFQSELRLRSMVQQINLELRQLKRDFLAHMADIYLALRMDPQVGFRFAAGLPEAEAEVALGNMLLAEQFAEIAMHKFIIQRRLLAGLKSAFVRFMPARTLVRLYRRYDSFAWLRHQSQCDLKRRLPAHTKDHQLETLYRLVEKRARLRAADDVLALTADNMQRLLQTLQWFLVESKHGPQASGAQLEALARNAKRVLSFYLDQLAEWAAKQRKEYRQAKRLAADLEEQLGGRDSLLRFVDQTINLEALDIDLNVATEELSLPPTISKQMVDNLALKWMPSLVLKSVEEDRRLLIERRAQIMPLVRLDARKMDTDLGEWTANILRYVCSNQVVQF